LLFDRFFTSLYKPGGALNDEVPTKMAGESEAEEPSVKFVPGDAVAALRDLGYFVLPDAVPQKLIKGVIDASQERLKFLIEGLLVAKVVSRINR
jgi:hypothetical protein